MVSTKPAINMKKVISDPPECVPDLLAIQDTLDVLSGKWTLLILHYLMTREESVNTFNKIEKDIAGISAKVLSKELKDLEANQLIIRTVQKTKPITVSYSISDHGKSTKSVIDVVVDWGKKHRLKLLKPEI